VPASSYCEPNGQSPATWYRFASYSEHERPQIDTYAFMTTEPNALTRASTTSACRFFCRARISLRRGFPVRWKRRLHSLAALIPVQCMCPDAWSGPLPKGGWQYRDKAINGNFSWSGQSAYGLRQRRAKWELVV